jgi:hypothetical protein
VNALVNPQVGQYLNRHFVSAFQRVATFQIIRGQKQGGNVASYFCTPEGRVLHALAGPVDADTFLREARWVNETFQLAQMEKPARARLQAFFRQAHIDRLQQDKNVWIPQMRPPRPDTLTPKQLGRLLVRNQHLGLDNQGKVHLLLAVAPLSQLEHIYRVVFEKILNEKISTNPVGVAGR